MAIKKNEILPFAATWMDLEDTKWSKTERQILYDITYMWNLKNNTDEFIYKIETDSQGIENKLMAIKSERGGKG